MYSTGYWITKGLIILTPLVWIAWDFWVYAKFGNAATESRETLNEAQSVTGPLFCLLVGVLICHLFVPRMEGSGIDGWRLIVLGSVAGLALIWLMFCLPELFWQSEAYSAFGPVWSFARAYPIAPILLGGLLCMCLDLQQHPVVGEPKPRLIGLPHFGGKT
jgi:hypothetical protein